MAPDSAGCRARSLLLSLLRGAVIGLVGAGGGHLGWLLLVSNFHVVVPGQVYRTNQPTAEQLRHLIARYHIRTVINLRGFGFGADWYRNEARVTSEMGISQEDLGFSAVRLPSPQALCQLIEVIDRSSHPILFHCFQGADRTGLAVHIVTQFGFNGNALRDWEPELKRHDVRLPIRAGIAGPAPLAKLIKFAMRCGIGASLRTVMRNLSAVSGGAELAITPDQHVMRLIQLPSLTRVVAPHFYSFGGAVETARWIGRVVSRDFVVDPEESGFLIGTTRRQ